METFWLIVALALVVIGIWGTIIPALPGIALIFSGYLVWGIASGWKDYGTTTVLVMGIITVISYVLDYYAGAIGAKTFGASRGGVWGAMIGAILGFIFFNLPGLVIGPFIGALVGELLMGRSHQEAFRAGWGAFLGFLAGSLMRVTIGVVMALLFFYYLIF